MRGGKLFNPVLFARQDGWTDDGWSIPVTRADLTATIDGWCDDLQAMIAAAPETRLFKWAINARTPLTDWVIDDRIVLMGDAAYAMTPFLGQSAACAIELTRACGVGDGGGRIATIGRRAQERAGWIQAESNANADRMQGADSDLFGLGKLVNETPGLFDYDCRTVPV